jgi:hypothetical protein
MAILQPVKTSPSQPRQLTKHIYPVQFLFVKRKRFFVGYVTFSGFYDNDSKSVQSVKQPPNGISLPNLHRSLSTYSEPSRVTVGIRYCSRNLHFIIFILPIHNIIKTNMYINNHLHFLVTFVTLEGEYLSTDSVYIYMGVWIQQVKNDISYCFPLWVFLKNQIPPFHQIMIWFYIVFLMSS